MASDRFVLCRRETNDFGAPVTYCGKAIKTQNPLNYCPDCRKNLPLWPADEVRNDRPTTQIEQELYLYYCAGGHTRAAMAGAALEKAGFKFDEDHRRVTHWPDGVELETKDGNFVYRGFQGAR